MRGPGPFDLRRLVVTAAVLALIAFLAHAARSSAQAAPAPAPAAKSAPASPAAPPVKPGGALYKPSYKYPILDRLEASRDSLQAIVDSLQGVVDRRYKDQAKQDDRDEQSLRMDWTGIQRPPSPEAFKAPFHFPPVAQYLTGTCWSFSSTSFFESEIARQTGRHVKLSEMWTVYWEYVEKANRFLREYGHSPLVEGSEADATPAIYKLFGVVPESAYDGQPVAGGLYDHGPLQKELLSYLRWIKDSGHWDQGVATAGVRAILDRYMGRPPERFEYEGKSYDPKSFLVSLQLNPDDYVACISTMKQPFGPGALLDVPDNWRRRHDYVNLPLDDFYRVIKQSLQAGYTVSLGGDVSEPGMDGVEGAAVIPAWDIPAQNIDQAAREFRFGNATTTDDHGMHAVGFMNYKGRDWLLVKDSNRSSRLGQFKGYYFYGGDYVRLKTLSFLVHKDRLSGVAYK